MFTGIVQGVAVVHALTDLPGLRSLELRFPEGFLHDVEVGASIAVDGVCLTVTQFDSHRSVARFDVMQQTLSLTTLGALQTGSRINVERAAREGAEVGGHVLSGHVDFRATLSEVRHPQNNHVMRLSVPAPWMRYIFAKGYIAVDGASLTVAEVGSEAQGENGPGSEAGWFEVWLIPETLRQTTFANKRLGDAFNIEIERATQVMVDTVRRTVDERLNALMPLLQQIAAERGWTLP